MTDMGSDDVAVVVYREEGDAWEAEVLPQALTGDLAGLIHALRQQVLVDFRRGRATRRYQPHVPRALPGHSELKNVTMEFPTSLRACRRLVIA